MAVCTQTAVIRTGAGPGITSRGRPDWPDEVFREKLRGSHRSDPLLCTNVSGLFLPSQIWLQLKCGLNPSALLRTLQTEKCHRPGRIPLNFTTITDPLHCNKQWGLNILFVTILHCQTHKCQPLTCISKMFLTLEIKNTLSCLPLEC